MKIASIIALYFKKLGVVLLNKAQLNLKDSKYFWPSFWVGLLVMLSLIFVRFDNPLPIQVHQPSAKIQFLSTDFGIYAQDRFQSLALFDTAPIFIPTQWNYGSNIFPDKQVSSLAEFSEFKPSMNLVENLELPRLKERGENPKTFLSAIYYEPRILNFSKSSASSSRDQWDSQGTLKLKVETLRGIGEQAVGVDFYEYQLEYSALVNVEQPVIVLLRNQDALAPRPILFKSSSVNDFDTAILGWLDEQSHLALLPKGLLRLTFYP